MFVLLLLVTLVQTAPLSVELQVFSSTANPSWTTPFASFSDALHQYRFSEPSHILGYTGFRLTVGEEQWVVRHFPELEVALLLSAPQGLVAPQVFQHVLDRINEYPRNVSFSSFDSAPTSATADCNNIVGPDTPPEYDPSTDDNGCFITMQGSNNCYDYGSDIVTNTFAQPGRGSGHKWTENTCESVGAGAVRDGLVAAGKVLPSAEPAVGHYVALLIWPNTNFHWIRMDKSLWWSHKPGGTPVRNVDDDGNKIHDPSKANFSPWTEFCGYYSVVPSNVTIN
eukprot:m.149078 g.149078  ORF g.149078 m.149078 type:complete len:282 (-) comp24417_c1_seq2:1709-2554(-)